MVTIRQNIFHLTFEKSVSFTISHLQNFALYNIATVHKPVLLGVKNRTVVVGGNWSGSGSKVTNSR